MATTNRSTSRPGRSLIGLGIIVLVLFGSIGIGTWQSDASWSPKLALDLEGGTQIILQPVTTDGQTVTSEDINQAIAIIRQRVDSSGVSEAEITSQGGSNIVVALPGQPSQETLDLVRESAQMQFRPVLSFSMVAPTALPTEDPTTGPTAPTDVPTEDVAPEDGATTDAPEEPATDATTEPAESGSGGGVAAATDPAVEPTTDAATEPAVEPTTDATEPAVEPTTDAEVPLPSNPSDLAQITPELLAEFQALTCSPDASAAGTAPKDPASPIAVCSVDGTMKYILGPMEIAGTEIDSASSGLQVNSQGVALNTWAVNLRFTAAGTDKFADVTTRLATLPTYAQWISTENPTLAPNMFAMVLDNQVIGAPGVTATIPDGRAEITGSYTRETATALANQLNFGALPLTFEVQSEQQISATLGSEQLEKGMIAGLIGLLLVVVYSLFQYRALGLVTVASLLIAGLVTYGMITLLSWTQGYRLSLPGVAGLIVAIGITADSFIVYFERIRDELRDGRSLTSAVDTGWDRARRTIVASDTVNFLAAVVLYFLAVGGVRGFAFTLGLTTLVDLIVVFFFTHPLMKLLARTRFFADGHPASGLDPHRLGATGVRYAGRGRVVTPATAAATPGLTEDRPAEPTGKKKKKQLVPAGAATAAPTMTIAERRALAAAEAAAQKSDAAEASDSSEAETEHDPAGTPPADDTRTDGTPASDERKDGNL
ncbi:protein-export membrane protein SecD [Sanguibacter keddieii DSM 10542]|uniref:Protein translocase subunit SecD n=1 Tax=Sanguibacter keddieii (strain ATCC 51767 / DSM 10542 / NCFB 3025 / ST-74) TaxID=446469 RepID=D1BGW2_SANKS|nr:protein translocase subunit SecD [Sanguibacter keddieii]ACZ21682.1 protein-export membrane protein SecD [Sanguibacter keddieii DSM 10542]